MSKEWNKNMHDRLKDFPQKAPEGLLDDIKSEMALRGLSPAPVTNQAGRIIFRVVSAAAMMLLLLGIGYLFLWEKAAILPDIHENEPLPIVAETLSVHEEEKDVPSQISATTTLVPGLSAQANTTQAATTDTITIAIEDDSPEKKTEEPDSLSRQTPVPVKQTEPTTRRRQWNYPVPHKKRPTFDIGVYYSGLVAQGSLDFSRESINMNPSNSFNEGKEDNDSTSTGSRGVSRAVDRSFKRYKGLEEAKHHIPVRLGVSLRYYLNERWSIQSGLTYSYLASDLSYKGMATSYETKQKLHYIGIPLQVGYRIWESKNFRGYISAGGQVEKLVSGKATTHYTLDDGSAGTLIESISDNRLLFSALASIGAEYALSKDFSLYAEPGIHYYFKNGNGLNTHYNEQPLNINITIGFRFHWNK